MRHMCASTSMQSYRSIICAVIIYLDSYRENHIQLVICKIICLNTTYVQIIYMKIIYCKSYRLNHIIKMIYKNHMFENHICKYTYIQSYIISHML